MKRVSCAVLVTLLLPLNLAAEPMTAWQRSIAREAAQLAAATPAPEHLEDQAGAHDRSWPGRHPLALGAAIGAAAGAIWGHAQCSGRPPCGDGHDVLLLWLGIGVGAGIGAGVGWAVGAATR